MPTFEKRTEPGKTNKPAFCIIAPTQYLDAAAIRSSTHLVLAHIVDKDPVYAQFYARMSKAGHRIIMDNGAFELGHSYDPDKLFGLAEQCGAHAIVLPDYPFRPVHETIEAAKKYIPIFKQAGFQTFFVPQSEKGDFSDVKYGYEWAAGHPDIDIIGMSILTFPNALPNVHPAMARVVGTSLMINDNIFTGKKYHHYLGLIDAALEIPSLIRLGVVDSLDSSNPVWAAINGYRYNLDGASFLPVAKNKLPEVDFNYPLKTDVLPDVNHNIDVVFDMFFNAKSYR